MNCPNGTFYMACTRFVQVLKHGERRVAKTRMLAWIAATDWMGDWLAVQALGRLEWF